MAYNELRQHGTRDFPFAIYYLDEKHPRYVMAFHWHNSMEIVRVKEGEFTMTVAGEKKKLFAGDYAVVNPDFVHGGTPNGAKY
ncbi:MAG: cupin domain-containing protein, partial [Clostridia bacterium]|nr:cupin domain-containing protein [Clostridia bacterium]